MKSYQSPIITQEEKTIRKQLAENKFSDKQALDILISQLAIKNTLTFLLYVDKSIYNEQFQLLLYLNVKRRPCLRPELYRFYDAHEKQSAKFKQLLNDKIEFDITYDQFLSFLIVNGLVSQNMADYSITLLGQDYVSYAIRSGRRFTEDKVTESTDSSNFYSDLHNC